MSDINNTCNTSAPKHMHHTTRAFHQMRPLAHIKNNMTYQSFNITCKTAVSNKCTYPHVKNIIPHAAYTLLILTHTNATPKLRTVRMSTKPYQQKHVHCHTTNYNANLSTRTILSDAISNQSTYTIAPKHTSCAAAFNTRALQYILLQLHTRLSSKITKRTAKATSAIMHKSTFICATI